MKTKRQTYFDPTELKEHLKTLPPNERRKVKDFESLRNLANYGYIGTGRGGKGK